VRSIVGAGADGVIVASALVDSLGADGRNIDGLSRLVGELRAATVRRA
jgi:tryptophan synthase alpha subunit